MDKNYQRGSEYYRKCRFDIEITLYQMKVYCHMKKWISYTWNVVI